MLYSRKSLSSLPDKISLGKTQKFEYLENENNFLWEIKSIFHNFEGPFW